MEMLQQISWVAAGMAFAVSFGLGAAWFNPRIFGQIWMDAQPHRSPADYGSPTVPLLVNAVATLMQAVFVVWLVTVGGIFAAALFAAVVALSMISGALFLGQKPGVWMVSTGYSLTTIAVMAVIGMVL